MSYAADVFDALDAEWVELGQDPAASGLVVGWLVDAGVLDAGCDLLLDDVLVEMERRDRRMKAASSDRWLGALLSRVHEKGVAGQLATRVVVQTMLPAAVRTAAGLMRADGRRSDEVASIVLAVLYETIARYPLERRPQSIAANLSLDTRKRAVRELQQEWGWRSDLVLLGDEVVPDVLYADVGRAVVQAPQEVEPRFGVAPGEVLAGARADLIALVVWATKRGLSLTDAAAVCEHYREDAESDEVVARRRGVRPAAVRQQRSRAVRRLKNLARDGRGAREALAWAA